MIPETAFCDGRIQAAHGLKTHPEPFQQILDGFKRHEFRRNDRDFKTGEIVLLHEYIPPEEAGRDGIVGRYTGRSRGVRILAISYGPEWGIPEGFAVFSFELLEAKMKRPGVKYAPDAQIYDAREIRKLDAETSVAVQPGAMVAAAHESPPRVAAPPSATLVDPFIKEDAVVASLKKHFIGDDAMNETEERILRVLLRLWRMLVAKNRAYGNSVLDPIRCFSKVGPIQRIRDRLDDKISRLVRGEAAGEDAELDLMGYLTLLKVAEIFPGDRTWQQPSEP